MSDELIKSVVMRRVWLIYRWRCVTDSTLTKVILLGSLFGATLIFVSIIDVVRNAAGGGWSASTPLYLFRAFTGTELSVQVISILTLLIAAATFRDLTKKFSPYLFFWR
jgi:hypothetical protein